MILYKTPVTAPEPPPREFRSSMPDATPFPNVQGVSLAEAAAPILLAATRQRAVEPFVVSALQAVAAQLSCAAAVMMIQHGGEWRSLGPDKNKDLPPLTVLGDALDHEGPARDGRWWACSLRQQTGQADVLALADLDSSREAAAAALAKTLAEALASVRQSEADAMRTERLEAILEIAGRWNQTHEMEPLLVQMAEAATRLLEADRASIFLWDKPNRMLVGRPALGVESGELRIPDNAGVVGQVVQTGQPQRVDRLLGQEQIDRRVDSKLGYQTQTLLCVPLVGRGGQRLGAFEVLNKRTGNFTPQDEEALVELAGHAAIALENTQELQRLLESRRQMSDQAAQSVQMIGESPAIQALRSTISRVAPTDLAVLITGENGTGKEVVSRMVHYLSDRRDEPFIAVNCAAITETLLESELFGHEKGAFTGADEMRRGKFELAAGGTLFLDEIGDMSPGGQAKLLRVLEEKVVVRVGGTTTIHTDARVVAATNQDLLQMVRDKKFREDLYFRLNVVNLELPPLRERREDVMLLAEHFLNDFCRKARRPVPSFSAEARKRMQAHNWPGNVRELRNLCERLAYLFQGETIEADDLTLVRSTAEAAPPWMSCDLSLNDATNRFQQTYIQRMIKQCGGNMSEAAQRLGMHRSNLYRKMRSLEMEIDGEN